jgi:hypothetical protein
MDQREHRPDHQGESSDHFGAARYRTAPGGVHQSQNGRDQRAGVADADPEHKIRFVKAPVDRPVVTGDADTGVHLVTPGGQAGQNHRPENANGYKEDRRRCHDRTQQVFGHSPFSYWIHATSLSKDK